jgi:hypothetical protein
LLNDPVVLNDRKTIAALVRAYALAVPAMAAWMATGK